VIEFGLSSARVIPARFNQRKITRTMSLKLHEFYKKFEGLKAEERYALIEFSPEPTSFFVLFQQLSQVRKQKEFFEERERHLLNQAEQALKKING